MVRAASGGSAGNWRPNGARLDRRQDRVVLDAGQVVGHHVDDGVGGLPECLRIHVDEPIELGRVEPVQWTAGQSGRLRVLHAAESTRRDGPGTLGRTGDTADMDRPDKVGR